MTLIYRAVSVEAYRLPVSKKTWVVLARGEVSSTGWTGSSLSPQGEQDDYLIMDFEAQPPGPGDVTIPVIVPIVALSVVSPPKNARGIVVRSESNEVREDTQVLSIDRSGDEEHDFLPYEIDQAVDIDGKDIDEDGAHTEIATPELLRPELRIMALATAGEICKVQTLLKVPLYPEFKTKGLKLYKRWRYNVTELQYCYPEGIDDAVRQVLMRCLPVAVAAGVAGFVVGGPAGAVAAFKTALEGCAAAEVTRLVNIRVRNREIKGDWKRV